MMYTPLPYPTLYRSRQYILAPTGSAERAHPRPRTFHPRPRPARAGDLSQIVQRRTIAGFSETDCPPRFTRTHLTSHSHDETGRPVRGSPDGTALRLRSEERRVGKDGRHQGHAERGT